MLIDKDHIPAAFDNNRGTRRPRPSYVFDAPGRALAADSHFSTGDAAAALATRMECWSAASAG